MKRKTLQFALEWVVIGLMFGAIMLFGKFRLHQLNMQRFLVYSYGVVAVLTIVFRLITRKFSPEGEDMDVQAT